MDDACPTFLLLLSPPIPSFLPSLCPPPPLPRFCRRLAEFSGPSLRGGFHGSRGLHYCSIPSSLTIKPESCHLISDSTSPTSSFGFSRVRRAIQLIGFHRGGTTLSICSWKGDRSGTAYVACGWAELAVCNSRLNANC